MAVDFQQEIKNLRTTMDSVREVTDLAALKVQIGELEAKASAPDLWDDPDAAQQVTSALSRANAEYERVTGMAEGADGIDRATLEAAPLAHAPDLQAPLLLICQSGRRSMQAAETLAALGYTDIASIAGGTSAWQADAKARDVDDAGTPAASATPRA